MTGNVYMKIRTCAALALALLPGLGLPGCSHNKEGAGVTITFWHSCVSSTVPALNELIARYQAEHPGITIRAQYVPSGDALVQKLITAVRSGSAPDVSWIHADFLQDLVESDAIYRIDDFAAGADSLPRADLDDIYPALRLQSELRGTAYCLPMEATAIGLLCNRELFRKAGLDPARPPATWDELRSMARRLTLDSDGDGKPDQVGFFVPVFPSSGPLSGWMVWQWYPFLFQAGGNTINSEQTSVRFNEKAGVLALSLWKGIYDDLHLKTFTIDYEVAFASGRLAMTLDGPWNIPRWEQLGRLDWYVAPLPRGPANGATVVGGEYLALFKQSRNPHAAWEFMKWMLRPDVQAMWSMRSGYLPVRHAVHDIPEYRRYLDEHPYSGPTWNRLTRDRRPIRLIMRA